jgi:hypothetical protein
MNPAAQLVELTEVTGPLDQVASKIYVNPAHVVMVERGINASNPDGQAFVSLVTLAGLQGKRRVSGSPADVRKALIGAR